MSIVAKVKEISGFQVYVSGANLGMFTIEGEWEGLTKLVKDRDIIIGTFTKFLGVKGEVEELTIITMTPGLIQQLPPKEEDPSVAILNKHAEAFAKILGHTSIESIHHVARSMLE